MLSLSMFVLAIAAMNLFRYAGYLLDDTFISFRYAKNLVEGNGLVFNRGEYVEGYTNFLFVILAAALLKLGIEPIIATKSVVAGMTLWMLYVLTRLEALGPRLMVSERMLPTVVLLLLPLPAFAYWAVASFETMLFASLLVWAVWLLVRESRSGRFRGAVVVFVLLALTRPEGAFLFVVGTVVFLVADSLGGSRNGFRRHARNVAVFSIVFGSYFTWRYTYYGDLFPNTFRAKVTGGGEQVINGVRCLADWARASPLLAATLALPIMLVPRRVRQAVAPTAAMICVYVIALAYAVYVVLIGGDFMPFFRFFIPLMPFCALLLSWTLASVIGPRPTFKASVITSVIVFNIAFSLFTDEPYRAFVAHRTAVVGKRVGQRLARELGPDDVIAVNTAGSLPYYAERPAIDMLGLTDPDIAKRPVFIVTPGWAGHRRGWGAHVLNRRPRLVFFYNSAGSREPFYLGDHELADNPYFRFFYRPMVLQLPAQPADGGPRAAARFLGSPFGFHSSGHAPWPDLGLTAEFRDSPFRYTVFSEGPVVANYFELDRRDIELWGLKNEARGNIDAFMAAVGARWRDSAAGRGAADPEVRTKVEAMCEQARQRIEAGHRAEAKRILTAAARLNERGESPLVYQYMANLAVLEGDLFTAVNAQKEALRLAPDRALYRENLERLLTVPYKEATKSKQPAS